MNANNDAAGASKASPRCGYLNSTVLMVMARNTMLIVPAVRYETECHGLAGSRTNCNSHHEAVDLYHVPPLDVEKNGNVRIAVVDVVKLDSAKYEATTALKMNELALRIARKVLTRRHRRHD